MEKGNQNFFIFMKASHFKKLIFYETPSSVFDFVGFDMLFISIRS